MYYHTNSIKMATSNEIDIKNRTCYYFDDKIIFNDLDLDNVLLNENSWQQYFYS